MSTVRLILGDQLNPDHAWFRRRDPSVTYVLMEVRSETDYVRHHAQKVLAIFAGMRRLADQLRARGHRVRYFRIGDPDNAQGFAANLRRVLGETQATAAFTCSDNSPATQPLSVYMAAYSSSAPTPTPAEVIAGVGTGIVAHAANTDARGASSVSVSGLSEYTEYALYLVAVDSAGQIGASEYRRSLTADTVAPTLDAVITSATETEITFSYTATDNSPG